MPAHDGRGLLLIRAHVRDVEHLEEVIDRFALYGQTTSSILQSAPVPGRGIAMGEGLGGTRPRGRARFDGRERPLSSQHCDVFS